MSHHTLGGGRGETEIKHFLKGMIGLEKIPFPIYNNYAQ